MRTWKALVIALALFMPSCLYGNFKHPLDTDVLDTKLGAKTGEASYQSVLWLVAWGDGGSKAAAAQGGITTLRHMDQQTMYILFGLYARQTTIVYGD